MEGQLQEVPSSGVACSVCPVWCCSCVCSAMSTGPVGARVLQHPASWQDSSARQMSAGPQAFTC